MLYLQPPEYCITYAYVLKHISLIYKCGNFALLCPDNSARV